jgi:predicted dehydrogenase
LIGAGAFGRFCYDAYSQSDDVTVIVVADPDPEALNQIDTSQVRVVRDWRDLMADDRVEAVHLATPPYLRLEMGLAALAVRKSLI